MVSIVFGRAAAHFLDMQTSPDLSRRGLSRKVRSCGPSLALTLSLVCSLNPSACSAQSVIVSSGPISAQPAGNQAPVKRFPLSGTVVDAVTGEPIRKALVQVYEAQQRTAFADDGGRFQFEGLPLGSYNVTAQKPGYLNAQELQRPPVMAEVGPTQTPVTVKLTPESVIAGKVTTATGDPLEHVTVNLTYLDLREGRRHWDSRGSTVTDEDGRYRFASLCPGSYYLTAGPHTPTQESMFEPEQPATTGYPGVYYPGAPDLASASPVSLADGQQTQADFSLNAVPVYRVTGTVSGYVPDHGVSLQIFDQSGVAVPVGYQFSEANGRFDIPPIPAGRYVIKAFSAATPNVPMRADVGFVLSGDLHNLHLALAPAPSIPIVVEMEGRPRQDHRASVGPSGSQHGPPVSVRLAGNTPGVGEYFASFENPNNPQSLSLRNVEPGRYSAIIDARDSWYVAAAEYGQTNLLTDDLVLSPGAPPSPLRIVLRNDAAFLEGRVNAPAGWTAPVTIIAVPEGAAKVAPYLLSYNGGFGPDTKIVGTLFEFLPPGDYQLFAFDHIEGLEYANHDALQNYASQATHVSLSPNQRARVELEIIRTAEASQ